ncbi:LmeA family phospholipid-binding protein [Streptomyces millisiae]|uniref:DUF2993 domain-containing protein n=1 Tax=Streptomyces millisiae TaxID=3075542 RepID=A0ABU2LX05_9ACTN|nr:DUF2993 domain-containing protein [Streptomyces sp. DSM 44918]MDT0322114.1 DUF2993 domain-containing protein [Streptomyces sp. DSM 44918]
MLAVLAVIADRVAVRFAQSEVASQARSSLGLTSEPSVTINGFPFLTQALGRDLNHVTLGLDDYEAEVDGQALMISELSADLRDVEIAGDFSGATAERADGEGLVSYEEMTRAYGELLASGDSGFGVEFGYGDGGQLLLTLQASAFGQTLDIGEVPGELVLDGEAVRLQVDDADIPDVGGEQVQAAIREQLDTGRTITGLPEGVSLDSVEPTEDGVRITISGSNVSLG